MKKLVALSALLLLFAASYADAGCAVVRRVVAVQHAYVAPYVAPVYALGYTGYYNGNYDAQQALIKDQANFIKLQTEAYQQLRQGLNQPRGEASPVGNYENYEAFARAKCIQCHQDGTAKAQESGFIMFEKDGAIAPFSLAEKRRQNELIKRGDMPPGNTLPQAERQVAAQLLSKK